MTQQRSSRIRLQRVALILAAVLVLGIVAYRVAGYRTANVPEATASASNGPETLADLEKIATDNPKDVAALRNLGMAYFEAQRFDDAARTYEHATSLAPQDASLWSALGEARVMASQHDPMPATAAAAFDKALALDPNDPRARYFHAVKRDLGGDHDGALTEWLALLADTPADAPWHNDLVRTIEQVGRINKLDVAQRIGAAEKQAPGPRMPAASLPLAAQGIPGPSQQDLAQASSMRPSDQRAMAEGMVERLEGRLRDDPRNVDGWVMLMRSRVTLQEPDKAAKALSDAVAANPGKADYLRQQAAVLGIK